MKKILTNKVITVVGASGYLGQNICRVAAEHGAQVNGISRRGYPPGIQQAWHENINWIRGNASKPESFADVLQESDLIVHTVGTLIDTSITKYAEKGTPGTYEQMNRDTLINVAKQIEGKTKPTLVYISASRGVPFIPRYLSTKQEAEAYLNNQTGQLKSIVIRPSFIYSWQQRWWSVPIKYSIDIWRLFYKFFGVLIPQRSLIGDIWKELEVDEAVKLDDVINACLLNAKKQSILGRTIDRQQIHILSQEFIID